MNPPASTAALRSFPWRIETVWAAVLAAAAVAVAALVTGTGWGPLLMAVLGGLVVLGWVTRRAVRSLGLHGAWLALLMLSILPGKMVAIGAGGQSATLAWTDAVLAAGVFWVLVRDRFVVRVPDVPFLRALLPFLAWATVSLIVARDPLTAIAELKEWVAAVIVAIAAAQYASNGERARHLLVMIAITSALMGLHMLYVAFTSPLGVVMAIMRKTVDLPCGDTNYLSAHLCLAIPLAIGFIGCAKGRFHQLGWTVVVALCLTGLVLSMSRGGILSLAVGLVVAFGLERRQALAPRLILAMLIGVAGLLYTIGPLQQVIEMRLGSDALYYSASERLDLYQLAWRQFLSHPIFGIGLNNFSVVSNYLRGVDTTPHNFEFGFLAELGLPGLLMALGWAFVLGRTAWRASRVAGAGGQRTLGLGLWAVFVAFAVHGQLDPDVYGQSFKMFLFTIAAATWRLATEWERERSQADLAARQLTDTNSPA